MLDTGQHGTSLRSAIVLKPSTLLHLQVSVKRNYSPVWFKGSTWKLQYSLINLCLMSILPEVLVSSQRHRSNCSVRRSVLIQVVTRYCSSRHQICPVGGVCTAVKLLGDQLLRICGVLLFSLP
jgi:hypothetical protein